MTLLVIVWMMKLLVAPVVRRQGNVAEDPEDDGKRTERPLEETRSLPARH